MGVAIFLFTLTLVIWKPRGIGIGWSALGGALLALIAGVITLNDIPAVWAVVGNATFTLIALTILALILDEAGFFRYLALIVVRLGMGRTKLLFVLTILLGAMVTALFTNDGTILIWTAVVIEMLLALGFSPRVTLVFAIATGFIADATSLPLPISNLTNIITVDYFHLSVLRYVLIMVPINFVAIFSSLAVLWFYFDRYLPSTYALDNLPSPTSAIRDPLVCRWSFPILGWLLFGYFLAEPLGIPVSIVASSGALFMMALAGRWFQNRPGIIPIKQILTQAPWQVIFFSLGMYLVVIGLQHAGLTTFISQFLQSLSHWGITQSAVGTGFLAALLSCIMNNLPAVLINSIAIQDATINPEIRETMIYANIIGCNIGSKITPIGTLSTLLWLEVLKRKKLKISWGQYITITVILTLPVLFISLLTLAIWLPWLIA